jgi:hypothetical protein
LLCGSETRDNRALAQLPVHGIVDNAVAEYGNRRINLQNHFVRRLESRIRMGGIKWFDESLWE